MLSFEEILSSLNKEENEEERHVIGWTCTYLPLEILEAGGIASLPNPSYTILGKGRCLFGSQLLPLDQGFLGDCTCGRVFLPVWHRNGQYV